MASQVLEVGGRRVRISGVSAQFAAADVQVSSSRNGILAELKKSTDGAGHDVAIVLAYLPEAELRELATQLPEVDAVIGGPTGQALAPERVGSTVVASATNKGNFLIELQLPPTRGEALAGKAVEITEQFPDHPEQQENLAQFYKQLAEHDFTPRLTSFASQFTPAQGSALQAAFEAARTDAEELAEVSGRKLGELVMLQGKPTGGSPSAKELYAYNRTYRRQMSVTQVPDRLTSQGNEFGKLTFIFTI